MADLFEQPHESNVRRAADGTEKVVLGLNQRKAIRVGIVLIILTAVSLAVGLSLSLAGNKERHDGLEGETNTSDHKQKPSKSPMQSLSQAPGSTANKSQTTGTKTPAETTVPSRSRVPTQYPTKLRSAHPSVIPTYPPSIASSSAPTPSPSTSAPTVCPSFPAPPPLRGKRGIAFTMRDEGEEGSWVENLPKVVAVKPYWFYSWGPSIPEEAQIDGVEFVPMIWGAIKSKSNAKLQGISTDKRVKRLLGFNEPDRFNQSNMNVSHALQDWQILESANLTLASPACAAPDGEWMQEFMARVKKNCDRLDLVAVHWYGPPNVNQFQHDLDLYYQLYNKPIMVTEFAVADWNASTVAENRFTRQQVLAFMKKVIPWLEYQDWIVAYSWFPFMSNDPAGTCSSLFDAKGNMTKLGHYYRSVSNSKPSGDTSITLSL